MISAPGFRKNKAKNQLTAGDTPNTEAVELIVATRTWVDARTTQVQEVRIAVIARSRRQIAPEATSIVRRRGIEEAGVEEVIRIASKDTRHYCASRS